MTTSTPMSALDSVFLVLDRPDEPMHIASVGIFDGPVPPHDEVVALLRHRLAGQPRYHQRLHRSPLNVRRPAWESDQHFRTEDHVHRVALPSPGDEVQFNAAVTRVLAEPLDHHHALWQSTVIEGLPAGQWALVSKVHHCLADGIAGLDQLRLYLDPQDGATQVAGRPPASSADQRVPHTVRRVVDAARHPQRAAAQAGTVASGLAHFAVLAAGAPRTALTGRIGHARTYRQVALDLDDITKIRKMFGGTLNDVVLAAVTAGYRDMLSSREDALRPIRALVPVSVRAPDAHGRFDNEVTAVVARLPIDVSDPLARLAAIRRETQRLKHSGEPTAGVAVSQAFDLLPAAVSDAALRAALRFPQWFVTTVVTNVPGPREPLYFAGRQLRELYPYVPIADRLRVGVAVLSYCGTLYLGVTGDRDHVGDLSEFCTGVTDGLAELAWLAGP